VPYVISVCAKTISANIANPSDPKPPIRIQTDPNDAEPRMVHLVRLAGDVFVVSGNDVDQNVFGSKVIMICDHVEVVK